MLNKIAISQLINSAFVLLLVLLTLVSVTSISRQRQNNLQLENLVTTVNPAVIGAARLDKFGLEIQQSLSQLLNSRDLTELKHNQQQFTELMQQVQEQSIDLEQLMSNPQQMRAIHQLLTQVENLEDLISHNRQSFFLATERQANQWQRLDSSFDLSLDFLDNLGRDIQFAAEMGDNTLGISAVHSTAKLRTNEMLELLREVRHQLEDSEQLEQQLRLYNRLFAQIQRTYPQFDRYRDVYVRLVGATGRSSYQSLNALVQELESSEFIELQQQRLALIQANQALLEQFQQLAETLSQATNDLIILNQQIANQSYQQTRAANQRGETNTFLLWLVSLVLAASIGFWLNRRISKPLEKLIQGLEALAVGNLRFQLPQVRGKEFINARTALLNTFNEQRAMIANIQQQAQQVEHNSQQIVQDSQQSANTLKDQELELDQLASAMNELDSSAQEVAQNAQKTLERANQADLDIHQSNQQLSQTEQRIHQLSKVLTDASERFDQVSHDANNIFSVLNLISSIAEKTNLLALNAAIEAARAGEQGRGFAVVADEVRSLAGQAKESTTKIADIVEQLQQSIKHALPLMGESTELASQAIEASEAVVQSLTQVQQSFGQLKDDNHNTASASSQQSQVIQELTASVSNLSQVNKAISESLDFNKQKARTLNQQATDQVSLVSHFHL